MEMNSTLIFAWALLAACFLGLLVYLSQLTRYEDEQLFLGEQASAQEEQHTAIVRKVTRLEPVLHLFGGAASVATASVVGVYVWNAWQQIR